MTKILRRWSYKRRCLAHTERQNFHHLCERGAIAVPQLIAPPVESLPLHSAEQRGQAMVDLNAEVPAWMTAVGDGELLQNAAEGNAAFEDEITPIDPAEAAFTDDSAETDALSVSDSGYKVVFLAFPFEAYGNATQKADLMNRAFTWFGS